MKHTDEFDAALELINECLRLQACEHVRGGEIIVYVPDVEDGGLLKSYLNKEDLLAISDAFAELAAGLGVQSSTEKC